MSDADRERRDRLRVEVASSESEGGGGFPVVGEAVELVEFDGEAGGAEFVEHAAAADGVELARVTDKRESPSECVGVVDELVEVGGVEHSGFVDHDRRPGRWRFEPGGPVAEVVEKFGDGIGSHAGLCFEDTGCFGCWCEPEHGAVLLFEVDGGGVEHGGLAGTGGSDDEHESVVSRDR
jgi:hypothetical protein